MCRLLKQNVSPSSVKTTRRPQEFRRKETSLVVTSASLIWAWSLPKKTVLITAWSALATSHSYWTTRRVGGSPSSCQYSRWSGRRWIYLVRVVCSAEKALPSHVGNIARSWCGKASWWCRCTLLNQVESRLCPNPPTTLRGKILGGWSLHRRRRLRICMLSGGLTHGHQVSTCPNWTIKSGWVTIISALPSNHKTSFEIRSPRVSSTSNAETLALRVGLLRGVGGAAGVEGWWIPWNLARSRAKSYLRKKTSIIESIYKVYGQLNPSNNNRNSYLSSWSGPIRNWNQACHGRHKYRTTSAAWVTEW